MIQTFKAQTPDELSAIAREALVLAGGYKLWAFYGEMGVGKTTFIHHFLRALDVKSSLGSPTYSIVNSHLTAAGEPVYHFDFYRFETPEEAFDIGYETYLFSGAFCFMEWPERLGDLLPADVVKVKMSEENGLRLIDVDVPGL